MQIRPDTLKGSCVQMERVDERFVLRGQGQGCQQNTALQKDRWGGLGGYKALHFSKTITYHITCEGPPSTASRFTLITFSAIYFTNSLLSTN